ncbi:MAG TPA: ABC transporter permease [Bryobacteraceae bacterium]|nr:ABC transporter permease [Bryobacteraceae bacterium]
MARFTGIQAEIEKCGIRLRFRIDSPCVMGWQIYDPETGAFLFEGEWSELRETKVDLQIALPEEDGPYRVHVAPVQDRNRFILIDARVRAGAIEISPPRACSAAGLRRRRLLRAIPKAFTYPPQSLWRNRKLIRSMVRREMLARYRGSFAGALWTFLNPLLLMATYAFIFGGVLKTSFQNDRSGIGYVLYFLAGMLPWLAFSEAVGRSPYVILEYRNFVKKLVFPLETLPVNLVIAGLVTELFGLMIFLIGLLAARRSIPASVIWLPVLIVPQLLLTAGLCWFLAALGVFVRDLAAVIGFILTLWFFLTPICYSEESLPAAARPILSLNPIFVLVRGYRAIFLENHAPAIAPAAALWIGSLAAAIIGYAWFHRLRRSFADVI